MKTTIEITENLVNGTVEFKRLSGLEVVERQIIPSCFEINWKPKSSPDIFEVYSGDTYFVIGYREVDSVTYPTNEDYYNYLEGLSKCPSVLGGGGGGTPVSDGEFSLFCDPNDNNRYVVMTVDLTAPDTPVFYYTYIDNSTTYVGAVSDLVICSSKQVTENFVCSGTQTLKQRTILDNNGNSIYLYFDETNALVAAPTTFTFGECKVELNSVVEQNRKKEIATFFDVVSSSLVDPMTFPFLCDRLEYAVSGAAIPITFAAVLVNNTTELAALFNTHVVDFSLEAKSATEVFIKEGLGPIPTDPSAVVTFFKQGFVETYYYPIFLWIEGFDGDLSSINVIEQNSTNFIEGLALSSIINSVQTYTPASPNESQTILLEDSLKQREAVYIQVFGADAWIIPDANINSNVRKGFFVEEGQVFELKPLPNGKKYYGPIKIINAIDGEIPTYTINIFNNA